MKDALNFFHINKGSFANWPTPQEEYLKILDRESKKQGVEKMADYEKKVCENKNKIKRISFMVETSSFSNKPGYALRYGDEFALSPEGATFHDDLASLASKMKSAVKSKLGEEK